MRRFAIVLAALGIALVAVASPAWAHVKINPGEAPKGSDAVLSFVVPNEEASAKTTKVVVQFPKDHPIADAATEPIPGWTAEVTKVHVAKGIQTDAGVVNDAVGTITWTATAGGGIAPENFQEFTISVGLPGDADSLQFPMQQTYSDSNTVNWVEQTPAGGAEPDYPVPELKLTAGGNTTATTTPASAGTAVKKSDVDGAKTTAIIAIIVGALGLLVGIASLTMRRRSSPTAS